MSPPFSQLPEEIQSTAAEWLARRDRGLNAAEQDAYMDWLQADPRHGQAIRHQEQVWGVLNQLEHWRPAHSAVPNPDLLAPRRRARIYWLAAGLTAAAVAAVWLMIAPVGLTPTAPAMAGVAPRHEAIVHPGPERRALDDGSLVELNQGAEIKVTYTADARRVSLLRGEAFFTVARDATRPFYVEAAGVTVRAIGTAFSVTLGRQDVAVLVTQGVVEVHDGTAPATAGPADAVVLTAGQRTVVRFARLIPRSAAKPQVQEVTPAEVERALGWQGMRLEFVDMPLGDVVDAFNRYNRRKLRVGDAAITDILVGGNFRADNVDAFVRLLESGFGIKADDEAGELVLRRAP
jgi:transmembrane sensor